MEAIIRSLTVVGLFCANASIFPLHAGETTAVDVGSHRELFVDRHLIDQMQGVQLELQHPRPAGVAMQFDRPWEGMYSQYVTVIKDGDKYLMYYRGLPSLKEECTDGECTCVAESNDGIHWTRPNLGIYEVRGTRENNVVLFGQKPASHNFAPFVDTRPGVPAAERFKAVAGTSGMLGYVSPDGRHWKKIRPEPIITDADFDSQNIVFWSESENCYVGYVRQYVGTPRETRSISRTTSPDFINWTKPQLMEYTGRLEEQFYTNATLPYFRAPHIYVALPMRFVPRQWFTDAIFAQIAPRIDPPYLNSARGECSDGVLMTSRGGNHYDRTFREAFFRPGLDPNNWVSRSIMAAWGIVPTGPGEMSVYYGQHDGQKSAHLLRCTLRTDGFASVNAPYSGGELLTKPLRFVGNELEINYSTSAQGSIRVEIQDVSGKPIPGFTLSECPEIIGDQIERVVAWKAGSDIGKLAKQPIRLRFVMKDADLYSLRFRPAALVPAPRSADLRPAVADGPAS